MKKRFGLMVQPGTQEAPVALAATVQPVETAVIQASFVPEKPLIAAPEAAPAEAVATVVNVNAQPEGRVFYVLAESVNVREGPGKDHAVVDRLPKGEAVLVLVEGEGADGWSFVRIEGDGVEGYVAARLLTE